MVGKLSLPEGLKEKIALLEKLYLILDLSGSTQKQLLYAVNMGSEEEVFPSGGTGYPHRHTAGRKTRGQTDTLIKKKTVNPGVNWAQDSPQWRTPEGSPDPSKHKVPPQPGGTREPRDPHRALPVTLAHDWPWASASPAFCPTAERSLVYLVRY